ncbi:MAG: efflux RND transporter periplasmic adaptor subunit [Flavobacteriaceae bacterium]|nr:efflux RND transporter periplasmic adaptor subunit [Flavobacteriaceae bacterium]MDH3795575.1 efflux RND transporter periplasmic adaptor subunit [Flavobacteriaceae bacterium]
MMVNKTIVYTAVALLGGLLLGYMLFGGNSDSHVHEETAIEATDEIWTCSMHPQIRQPEAGSCPICGMDLIKAENGDTALKADQIRMTENALQLADIQTTKVGMEDGANNTLVLSGKIQENEEANTVQVAYFNGRIERLQVNFTGEQIRKGQLLGRIYSPELVSAQQELLTAATLKESQPQLYSAVRNKLKLWKLSDNQIREIESSGKVRENFPVYSTVSGVVTEKLVAEGDYIKQGQPLFRIANLSTVWAIFDAYESQISSLKLRQSLVITTQAIPDKKIQASISFIDPVLNSKTRTVRLRATLNNVNNQFKPGMFVQGLVAMSQEEGAKALTIPASAVLWTGKRSVVYVKPQPGQPIFELREIQLGQHLGDQYEVLEGLTPGEEIVTNGTFTVDAAAQLQGKKSMMNQEGGKTMTGHEGHGNIDHGDVQSATPISDSRMAKIKVQFGHILDAYIMLTDALVASNAKKASAQAKALSLQLEKMDVSIISDREIIDPWSKIYKELVQYTDDIQGTADLLTQRQHFKPLSNLLISGVELIGTDKIYYSVYCPMADNNNGAYWISSKDEVLNPYYGSSMLKCGAVKEKFN